MQAQVIKAEEHDMIDEPYSEPVGNEIAVFTAVYRQQLPVFLKGPTGGGETV